jgi:Protein of unknown function (DUF3180)
MQPTRIRLLVMIAIIGGVVGWVLATLADSVLDRYLPLPWTAAAAVWVLVAALAMWGWIVRPRLLRRPGTLPLPPYVAARTAALALAASRVGAGVAGVYGGIALALVGSLEIPAAHDGAITAGVTALGGVAMAAVALWLERMCRIKEDDDDQKAHKPDAAIGGIASGTTERTSA